MLSYVSKPNELIDLTAAGSMVIESSIKKRSSKDVSARLNKT